jgi:hypothetical protein
MVDFGTDVSTFPVLDVTFSLTSGQRVVGEQLARRLMTPRGSLPWAPNDGLDLRGMLSAKFTASMLYKWRSQIVGECEKDERVRSADVTITPAVDFLSAVITITVTTADGPFALVLGVDKVTVSLLDFQEAA